MRKTIIFIGYLVIFFSILFLYLDYQAGKPISNDETKIFFTIEKGDGLKEISQMLEKEGFIKDKNIFILYVFLRNLRKNFLPGKYELKKNLSLKEVINILTSSGEKEITIIEGWNNNQIASYLENYFTFKKGDFLKKTKEISLFKDKFEFLKDEKIKNLEGFLFPDTYRFSSDAEPTKIISKMLVNFDKKLNENLREEIKKRGKTIYEIIILASILEKEADNYKDKELISDIFWRRLAAGIALQADSTINYITGKNVRQVSADDIKIDSPYNTYKYRGLPPGPICNPGLDSIKAAIYPKKNSYWYFLNSKDGTTIYSKNFEEHKANKIKYLNNNNSFKNGELLVKYKNDEKIYKLTFDPKENLKKIAENLKKNKNIEIVEPNYLYQGALTPDDQFYNEEWFLERIGAPMAWDLVGGGSENITIALIDSGVDINHPDLKDNIWVNSKEIPGDNIDNDGNGFVDDVNGWDFVENKPDPRPKFFPSYTVSGMNHGTVVAGVAAAVGQNKEGIIGLAWKVKLMPIRVLNNRGEGTLEAVIKGIDYAIKNKADIINLSFVGPNRSELFLQAVEKAWNSNILIVAAAGNNSKTEGEDLDKKPLYPICLDSNSKENFILGVTATNEKDEKAPFANYGNNCVDISAPGSKIFSTLFYFPQKEEFKNYYGGYWSGTSVATPLVSATAALIKSIYPLATNREIRNIILESVKKFNPDMKLGQGRLNTYEAIAQTYQKLVNIPHYRYLVTGPSRGSPPLVRIFRPTGIKVTEFYAYNKNFRGGVNVAAGDLNDDGIKEIITGAGKGGGPQVRIFNDEGKLLGQFFAYDENLRNGINVATGDVNGDGLDEIIVGPQTGSLPVRVFDWKGTMISEFYAYDPRFEGGVSLTTSDLDDDGIKEIITGAGKGGGPQVRIFDFSGQVKGQFFAYSEAFRGGINVAAGDLNGDGLDEIVVAIASKASPYLRIFDRSLCLRAQFLGYDRKFYQGVSLTIEDLDGDRISEIIVGPFSGGGPQIRIFDSGGEVKDQFFAYEKLFNNGLSLTTIKKFE